MKTSNICNIALIVLLSAFLTGCALEKEVLVETPIEAVATKGTTIVRKRFPKRKGKRSPIEILMRHTAVSDDGKLYLTITANQADTLGISKEKYQDYCDYLLTL